MQQFKIISTVFCLLGLFGLFGGNLRAQTLGDLEARVSSLEGKLNRANPLDGLNLAIEATMIVQGTSNANASGITTSQSSYKGNDVTDASYSLDISAEKVIAPEQSTVFLQVETGEGHGVTDNLEVFSNVNRDADDSGGALSLTELWWEQEFDNKFFLRFGKIDTACFIDTNEYANCERSQFLGDMFRNSPVVEFPDNIFGVRLGVDISDMVVLDAVVADGDGDFAQAGDSPWIGVQANIKPELMERPGNYRFIYWYNDAPHTKWNDVTQAKEASYGFGVSFDQEIIDNLGVFIRAGWQDKDVFLDPAADGITAEDFSLESAYSAGVNVSGGNWGRKNDVLGLAFGTIKPSGDYKQTQSRQAKNESHIELYYNCKVNDNISLTPDLQFVLNPFGKDATNGDSAIIAGGLRTQIEF